MSNHFNRTKVWLGRDGRRIPAVGVKTILLLLGVISLGIGLSACVPALPYCRASELVAPSLLEPGDGASLVGERSTRVPREAYEIHFAWNYPVGTCTPGAFQVDISDNADFIPSPSWGFATLDQRETSRNWQLPPGCYFWRVAAYSRVDDRNGPWSVVRNFCLAPAGVTPAATPGPASIAGWVYIDENENAVREAEEGSISGALLTLKAGACPGGADIVTVELDVTGRYSISPVDPGDYCLATSPIQQTLDPTERDISVAAGESLDDVNFRYLLGNTAIAGWVYIDENANDIRDAGEGSISGALLTLKAGACPGGADIVTVESDTSGRFVIMPVDPGDYCLATSPIQQTLYPAHQAVSAVSGVFLDEVNFRYLLEPLATDTPVPTATPSLPMAAFLQNANCRMGPDGRYGVVTSLLKGQTALIEGRNQEGTWWWILIPGTNAHCWASGSLVEVSGDLSGLRVIIPPPLPTEKPTAVPGCWVYNQQQQKVCVAPCPPNAKSFGACTQ